MKKIIVLLSGLFFVSQSFAQQPVEWSFFSKKINNSDYEVHLTATIEKGWFIYSQFSSKNGPAPTEITVAPAKEIKLSKNFDEQGVVQKRRSADQNTKIQVFENQVDFVQVISVRGNQKPTLEGAVSFVASNGSQTLPRFTVNFAVPLN
ncbi:MAG: hypothetical protein ACTHMM_08125 [Agriterribacter sp.]